MTRYIAFSVHILNPPIPIESNYLAIISISWYNIVSINYTYPHIFQAACYVCTLAGVGSITSCSREREELDIPLMGKYPLPQGQTTSPSKTASFFRTISDFIGPNNFQNFFKNQSFINIYFILFLLLFIVVKWLSKAVL